MKIKKLLTALFGDVEFTSDINVPFSVMLLKEEGMWHGVDKGEITWNPQYGLKVKDNAGENHEYPFDSIIGIGYEVAEDTVSFGGETVMPIQIRVCDIMEGVTDYEVQVNGVPCATIKVHKGDNIEERAVSAVREEYIGVSKQVRKVIVIPNKLVNIVAN